MFEKLRQGDKAVQEAFGEFVHWGYWDNSRIKIISAKDFHFAAELMTKRVVENAEIRDGYKILDVGCGFGGTIKLLNEKYNNCEFTGINIDSRQIAVANKEVTSKNNNRIEFIEADACALPFYEPKFDIILCVESIFHFKDRQVFFNECQRVLKSGGKLVISDFVPVYPFGSFMNFIEHKLHLVNKAYGVMRIDISILGYKKIARNAGFSVKSVKDITVNTFPTYKFLKQNFSAHLPKSKKRFSRATSIIEYASKLGLLKYLILTFNKNDKQ